MHNLKRASHRAKKSSLHAGIGAFVCSKLLPGGGRRKSPCSQHPNRNRQFGCCVFSFFRFFQLGSRKESPPGSTAPCSFWRRIFFVCVQGSFVCYREMFVPASFDDDYEGFCRCLDRWVRTSTRRACGRQEKDFPKSLAASNVLLSRSR